MTIAPSKDHPDTGCRGNLVRDPRQVNDWHARRSAEPALELGLPIIDSHTHFWDLQAVGNRYLFEDMLADVQSGRNVEANVFIEAAAMYRATVPALRIVVNHVGGMVGIGPYLNRRDEVFVDWRKRMAALAKLANVHVKLAGMGMPLFGYGFHLRSDAPDSKTLAIPWKPVIEICIELSGADRCMLESDFPVDKQAYGYSEVWNAFKRITASLSASERAQLFKRTAANFYRMNDNKEHKQ